MKIVRNVKVSVTTIADVRNVGSSVAKCPPITTPIAAPDVILTENLPITSVKSSGGVRSERYALERRMPCLKIPKGEIGMYNLKEYNPIQTYILLGVFSISLILNCM